MASGVTASSEAGAATGLLRLPNAIVPIWHWSDRLSKMGLDARPPVGPEQAMLISIVAVIVALVGCLVYALSANGKLQELGRIAFFVGLFWTVAMFAKNAVRLL
jgi:hypothetical protein